MKTPWADWEPADWAALLAAGALTPEDEDELTRRRADGWPEFEAEWQQFAPILDAVAELASPVAPPPRLRDLLLDAIEPSGLVLRFAGEAQWQKTKLPGVDMRVLFRNPQTERVTVCVRMAPGAVYPGHVHDVVEECLVLEGDLRVGGVTLGPGDFQAALPGSKHPRQRTTNGCLLMLTMPAADLVMAGVI